MKYKKTVLYLGITVATICVAIFTYTYFKQDRLNFTILVPAVFVLGATSSYYYSKDKK
jgi:hypothetical protein